MGGRLFPAQVNRLLTTTRSRSLICSISIYFFRAGVLYMFNDAQQKLPNMVIALYECKGARRAAISNRPHCFELLLKTGFMQLAAPDEYVASEWLQALVQAASGVRKIIIHFSFRSENNKFVLAF